MRRIAFLWIFVRRKYHELRRGTSDVRTDSGEQVYTGKLHAVSSVCKFRCFESLAMDLLLQEEKVEIDAIYGHGGIFKTKGVAQNYLAAALDTPVSVMETAGEGGPWGMALLAAYLVNKEAGETLADYLADRVFADAVGSSVDPDPKDVEGFDAYAKTFKDAIAVEQTAVEKL